MTILDSEEICDDVVENGSEWFLDFPPGGISPLPHPSTPLGNEVDPDKI